MAMENVLFAGAHLDKPKIKCRGEEDIIQEALIAFLRARDWYVNPTHGNMYQRGFPDLFCSHRQFGPRWVEVKCPRNYGFTPAQLREFPKMNAHGTGVWVLSAATEDEYKKLFLPYNWSFYLLALNQRGVNVSRF